MYNQIIACDLDGTLLPEGRRTLSPELFAVIRALKAKGVLFCCASGRSYQSLLALFTPVKEEMVFLAENGALAYAQGEELYRITMPRALCAELSADIQRRDDCYARINTTQNCYMLDSPILRAQRLTESEDEDSLIVADFGQVEGDVTKITAVSPGSIEPPAAALLPAWGGRIGGAITGEHWLDFTAAGKDVGLLHLCRHYGIPQQSTTAFGDNYNDVPMLRTAATAYLISTAAPALRAQFPNQTASALQTLQQLERELR